MIEAESISTLPTVPAVYAMYGGDGRRYVAYVGIADSLKRRVAQHLVNRDSSAATGTAAVGINPDYVREVRWWERPDFRERHVLQAAELVAFDVLDPALRSRGTPTGQAHELYRNEAFVRSMTAVFTGQPSGRLALPSIPGIAERVQALEARVAALEARCREGQDS